MPIYMKFGEIKGSVTTKGWEQWIDLGSASLSVSREIKPVHGNAQSREAASVHVSEVAISKEDDPSSADVFQEALTGDGKTIKIHFLQSKPGGGGATLQTFMEWELEGALISNYGVGGGGGGKPSESLALSYVKISNKRIEYDKNNKPLQPKVVTYDAGTTETG
jgi:type VI secretion system secreted protein Hcp